MSGWFTSFMNCRLCRNGEIVEGDQLVVSDDSGEILHRTGYIGGDAVDLEDGIIAPGFIELQTNGMRGFHFTNFDNADSYRAKVDEIAAFLPSQGVTGFYATVPTVPAEDFQKILPHLAPRSIPSGATLLGAHTEGPYLHPSKNGAHNASLFHEPLTSPPALVYGPAASSDHTLKLVTLAPELRGATDLISSLSQRGTRVSLGHSTATYAEGASALPAGATGLTHTLNAMAPLHHREPGLAGLVVAAAAAAGSGQHDPAPPKPYFSLIADGHHLHPAVAAMLFRSGPERCMLVTDSVELAGLPDGTYAGHAQVEGGQTKIGSKVVKEGTDTLVGGCASLAECVRNLMRWSGCDVAQAVRCVTENVAEFMGDGERGKLEEGRRADFVVLDDEANVLETWMAGRKVWERR